MSERISVNMVKLNELCGRTDGPRRGVDPLDLRYDVRFSVPFRDPTRRPDGWVHFANLLDDIQGLLRHIVWEPKTDWVRIYGPR